MPTSPMTTGTSKKRKRGLSLSEGVSFKLSAQAHVQGEVGPVLVSFPALEAPAATPFRCYARKRPKANTKNASAEAAAEELEDAGMLVVGETDSVEFVSNEDESKRAADTGCRYLLALHDPRTSSLTVLPTPTSPHILTHTVKALKSLHSAVPSALQYTEARKALGETFGTKKAKAVILARERNRVDVGAMEGVVEHLMDGIEKGVEGLMTSEEAKSAVGSNRLIPPFSAAATDPAEVYPLHGIIPEPEWKAISVSALEETADEKKRESLLPHRWSGWLKAHLNAEGGKRRKKTLKILYYISSMMAFRRATERKVFDRDEVEGQMVGVPSVVVDSLLARFTEVPRGSKKHQSTTATQTLLLTHIFALCLRVDDYATDIGLLANDFSLPPPKVKQLFKSLGCKIAKLSDRERARRGLADSTAETQRAILSAPVVFPNPKKGKRK